MNILDDAYIAEQNKIASSGAWIWLLEIATPSLNTLRYANNNSDVTWPVGGNTYSRISFLMSDIKTSTSGEFPEYKLQIGDVDLNSALRTHIKAAAGLVGSTIRLIVVHSAHLDLSTPAIDELTEILNCELTAEAVIFTIGIPSLLGRRFPRDRYVPSFCRHKFAGALCRYVQPDRTRTSSQISFAPGVSGEAGIQYNTITCGIGNLIQDVFRFAPGVSGLEHFYDRGSTQKWTWILDKDTGFSVSGSKYNDGFFLANGYHPVTQLYVRVFIEADGARPFVAESSGNLITIRLGYDACDHTLEACALRNNTQNFGGSPGISGGMYG